MSTIRVGRVSSANEGKLSVSIDGKPDQEALERIRHAMEEVFREKGLTDVQIDTVFENGFTTLESNVGPNATKGSEPMESLMDRFRLYSRTYAV